MAWLNSAPKLSKSDKEPKPRSQTLADESPNKRLPEANEYLVDCFNLIGRCSQGGMGPTPLSWIEVESFSKASGYRLNGWQAEQLVMMSREYCSMLHKAKELHCPPPYSEGLTKEEEIQEMRERVAKQWDSFTAGYKGKNRGA